MNPNYKILKNQINAALLKITASQSANIIIAEINTYSSDLTEPNVIKHIPFLDFFIIQESGNHFDQELKKAIEHDEDGYISDLYSYEESDYIEAEINLESIYYPDWPENIDTYDKVVVSLLKEVVANSKKSFFDFEKFYFHHISELEFVVVS
ncbi:hypothetical protein MNBD_GAMMA10-1248 [hydrothermal vent metagenome]|uniref:Uncharacterized protein n=1 Tax=hydrothermal vent metagenome TaxID=652676 RepID=A0A3B0XDT6_9ZZZZ